MLIVNGVKVVEHGSLKELDCNAIDCHGTFEHDYVYLVRTNEKGLVRHIGFKLKKLGLNYIVRRIYFTNAFYYCFDTEEELTLAKMSLFIDIEKDNT